LPEDGNAGCGCGCGRGAAAGALGGAERGAAAESSETVGGASRTGVPVVGVDGETVCSLNGFGAALGADADGAGSLRAVVVGVGDVSDGARSRSPTK
jgi:hypothetical protein